MSESPMIGEVDKIVANLLIAEGAVFIPGVGSLHVMRRGARRVTSKKIEPPCRYVEFTSKRIGTSLADAVAQAAGCGQKQAHEIFGRWLAHVRKEETLAIGGVGVLRQKSFATDAAFDKLLNPQGHEVMTLRSGRGGHWLLWTVAVIAIVCGIGVCGWILYDQIGFSAAYHESSAEAAVVATPAGVPESEVLPDSHRAETSPAETEVAGASEVSVAGAERVANRSDRKDEHRSGGMPASGSSGAVGSALTDGSTDRPTASDAMEAAPLVSGHTYVVLGVYSSLENARRALREVERQEPALRCRIYIYGPKYMVSMFTSESPEAGRAFVRAYSDRFPDMWTYRAR